MYFVFVLLEKAAWKAKMNKYAFKKRSNFFFFQKGKFQTLVNNAKNCKEISAFQREISRPTTIIVAYIAVKKVFRGQSPDLYPWRRKN